jgi:HAD superfamily hydrolase (TIGR01490 family)
LTSAASRRPGDVIRILAPVTHASRTAAFFDLDKTIIAKSSVLAFGRPFYQGGLINRRAVLRSAYAQFMFALAGADSDQIERMRAYLTSMCTGWDVAQVRDIVSETLHEIIDPIVYNEAVDLIALHKAAGRDVVIVSTSGEEVVAPIGAMLGADHVVATTWSATRAGTPARSAATPTARRRRSRCASSPPNAATTCR